MSMDLTLLEFLLTIAPNSVSIISCLWFFYSYYFLLTRTLGLKMILVLAISDFTFHTMAVLGTLTTSLIMAGVAAIVLTISLRFSIFWACNMAYLLYRLLRFQQRTNLTKYFAYSIVSLLILSCSFTFILWLINTENTIELDFLYYYTVTMAVCLVSISLTTIYYRKSIAILRENARISHGVPDNSLKKLYQQSFVQLLTLGVGILFSMIGAWLGVKFLAFRIIQSLSIGLAGFANMLVYFFQRKSPSHRPESSTLTRELVEPNSANDTDDEGLKHALRFSN